MEPPGGVEQNDVIAFEACGGEGALGNRDRRLTRHDRQGRNIRLPTKLGQLLLRRRAAGVERGHQHLLAFPGLQPERDFGARGGLSGALQPNHQNGQWRSGLEFESRRTAPSQHLNQMVVDDLDNHLRRGDALQYLLANRALANRADEVFDNRQRDIGLEQCDPHFAQSGAYVLLGERATAAQAIEDLAELG